MHNEHDETIKVVAVVIMVISHIGKVFDIIWISAIGEMCLPVFAYLISRGLERTRDKKEYIKRLAFWGAVSQIPYILAFEMHGPLNAIMGLCVGALLYEAVKKYGKQYILIVPLMFVLGFDVYPVLLILAYGLIKERGEIILTIFVIELGRYYLYSPVCMVGMVGVYVVYYLKKVVPVRVHKIFYYAFYPVHLLILGVVRWAMTI